MHIFHFPFAVCVCFKVPLSAAGDIGRAPAELPSYSAVPSPLQAGTIDSRLYLYFELVVRNTTASENDRNIVIYRNLVKFCNFVGFG